MLFEVLLDKSLQDAAPTFTLTPIHNKQLLSIVNDFEDGTWRYKKFQSFIWDNVAETSLSYLERESLVNHSLLTAAASNLRLTDTDDDIGKGSELAEILLYGIMRHHYKALPVVPKIFQKQNVQDNAKGADSVHIVIDENNDFTLWFGEAKFYTSIDDARLSTIVTSVGNSLRTDKLKKECSIITSVRDIDHLVEDPDLRKRIHDGLEYKNSIDELKPLIHVPILLLYECPITKKADQLTPKYRQELEAFQIDRATSYFRKQIEKIGTIFKYPEISFHMILFPVPEKAPIVDRFVKNVEHYRAQ